MRSENEIRGSVLPRGLLPDHHPRTYTHKHIHTHTHTHTHTRPLYFTFIVVKKNDTLPRCLSKTPKRTHSAYFASPETPLIPRRLPELLGGGTFRRGRRTFF